MVDTTEIPEAEEGDEVTLIGKDGDEEITVEELPASAAVSTHEILCDYRKTCPQSLRRRRKSGRKKDYFDDFTKVSESNQKREVKDE